MSKEIEKKGKKNILNTLWIIIFIVLAVGSITINDLPQLQLCLGKQVELKAYYMNYIWPAIYRNVNYLYAIIVTVCGITFFRASNDISTKLSERSIIHTKNISMIVTAITGGLYGTVGIVYFKSVSIITVVLGLMIVLTIVSLILNIIEYRKLSKDETALEVYLPVIKKTIVIIIVSVIGGMFLLVPISEEKKEADNNYNMFCEGLVHVGFGHAENVETNRALVKYEFVKMYSDSGREYDLEQLKAEYGNYLSGEGSWSNLWYFCHDSADIELKSQKIGIYTVFYPYYEEVPYYCDYAITDYYDMRGGGIYTKRAALNDKLGDLEFFCVCVEEELNGKGLTLRQEGDSSEKNYDYTRLELEYQTASEDEILAACQNFAANVEPTDGSEIKADYVDALDISMELNVGMPWQQSVVTENNGYTIDGYYMKVCSNEKTNQFDSLLATDYIREDKKYRVDLYILLPTATEVAEHIDVSVDSVNAYYLTAEYDETERNRIHVYYLFTTKELEETNVDSITVGYKHIRIWNDAYDVKPKDINPVCTIDSIEWSVYNVNTGELQPHTGDTFAKDNLCYVATMKIVPDADVTFEDVKNVYLQNNYFGDDISVPEYDESLHKYTSGTYPKAYYEKHLGNDGDYIMLYLPYYQVETKGVNGDVLSVYGLGTMEEENFIYVIEGSKVKLEEESRDVKRYEVKKTDGTIVSTDEVITYEDLARDDPEFITPAYPIEITGYY